MIFIFTLNIKRYDEKSLENKSGEKIEKPWKKRKNYSAYACFFHQKYLHQQICAVLTINRSTILVKQATLSSKFCASQIFFSYQYVSIVDSRIIRNALGDSFSRSLPIQTVPTNSEGLIDLLKKKKKKNN